MVRETRHLWVGNLPDTIREERVRDHFKRYGRVQSVKLLPGGAGAICATVAFMDIKSAAKAHNVEHTLDEHVLSTEYYEPSTLSAGPPTRFPLGGVPEDHPAFDRSSHFYERGSTTPGSGGSPLSTGGRSEGDNYLRRPPPTTYHVPPEPLRGRPRERIYRNGPTYSPVAEKPNSVNHRRTWQYEGTSARYTAPATVEPTESLVKCDSRSGSQSSRSRSPARSSSPSTGSSGSSERSTSPADGKVRLLPSSTPPAASSGTTPATLSVYSDDRRPLAICVRDLPARSSDTSLKDGLFHEYKKHGKVTWVKVVGSANDRYALVCFKKPEDVDKAIEVSQDKFFFGCKIDVGPYHGYDVEDNEARPYDTELDEYHPKATRTLFIGNLEKEVTVQDIRQTFEQFGEILEVDVKKQSGVALSFAFCQFADIVSVVQAIRTLDGELLGESRLKLGFGKSMPSSCVWVAGVADQVSKKYLDLQFRKFGALSQVVIDRSRGQALLFFDQLPSAAAAVKEMRGVALHGKRVQVDFASRECQEAFFERTEAQREATWTDDPTRFDGVRPPRYDSPRVRSSSYTRGSGSRTPRRHDVFTESPRYRSFEDLSPGSDYEEFSGDQSDLNHLHKRRDQIQKLLRLDTRDKEKNRPTRSVTAADQGLVVTAHNHRRRLSSHRRSSGEGPAPLCKRRKTGSTSEDERRRQHLSGDESRPGTPLIDELPDQRPKEPRKGPMKRPEEPLSLPLPEFAAHCFQNIRPPVVSAPMSPPRSASPPAAPPLSPVRPPSPLSSSSSEISPQSPTLEERIKSLDEKYEQWSGRTQPVITKPRHHLLDIDLRELQPSDIVKSVLARPSVFDEDSKRLENVNEKYEPKDFSTYQRPPGLELLTSKMAPNDPRSPCYAPVSVRVSPHGSPSTAVLSPAAKGLQYPFPSHPPMQASSNLAPSTADSPPYAHMKMMSKSMEFSVLKAESWLGINRSADSNVHGFSPRFHASGLRHKPDATPVKLDGKPTDPRLSDPRLEKPTAVPPPSPSSLVAPSTPNFAHRVVNRLCENEWSKGEKSCTKSLEAPVDVSKSVLKFNNRVRTDSIEHAHDILKTVQSTLSKKVEPLAASDVNVSDKKVNCPLSAEVTSKTNPECTVTPVETSKDSSVSLHIAQETETKLLPSDNHATVSAPNNSSESSNLDYIHQSESTKTLEPISIKPNHLQGMNFEVPPLIAIAPVSLVQDSPPFAAPASAERKSPLPPAPNPDVKSSSNGGIAAQSHSEPVPPKFVSDYVPFNVRDKESGEKKSIVKDKDKNREEKDKVTHSEKEKHKEKTVNEKERHKSLSREKAKDRELPENVDKERKKDRDVEIERRKDRESMEITERERRKGSCDGKDDDVELEIKKDQHDTLDRRKGSSDKKVLDHHERKSIDHNEKSKRKDDDREKRKDNVHEREKRKEHSSSDRHRKISEDRKREDDKHREKDKSNSSLTVAASIGEKRRLSSQDSAEGVEEAKRAKHDHKRRDSRDSRGSGASSSSNSSKRADTKAHELKSPELKNCQMKPPSDSVDNKLEMKCSEIKKKEESDRKKHSLDSCDKYKPQDMMKKIKLKVEEPFRVLKDHSGKCAKDNHEKSKDVTSDTDDENKPVQKEVKDKRLVFGSSESLEDKKLIKKEKRQSTERKKDDDLMADGYGSSKEKPREMRRENGILDSCTDSDSEPKKHSIFDVVDDEPAYISMYDKVKARSTKNLQKQAEEKKQTKVKEKFSQLKHSRAKREDKKRSTSWDEDSDSDSSQLRRRRKRLSSEDENKPTSRLRAVDLYTDDDSDSLDKSKAFALKSKLVMRDEESLHCNKRATISPKIVNQPIPKAEKILSDSKCKVRLSLDSSAEFSGEIRSKKRICNDTLSENECTTHNVDKSSDRVDKERRKARKKEKRLKSSEDEKFCDNDLMDVKHVKNEKKERRKSLQICMDNMDDIRPKKKSPKLSANLEHFSIRGDKKFDDMFGSCEDSDQSLQKAENCIKSVPSKWLVDDIYNSEPDEFDALHPLPEAKRLREKKKKDKKIREPSKDVIEAGHAIEQRLGFVMHEPTEGMKEELDRIKINKEKKKKRKKSKDEKSSRHHHYHHHHHHERIESETNLDVPPPIPILNSLPRPPSPLRSPSPSPTMPVLIKSTRGEKAHIFGCGDEEKRHESAVNSISMPEIPKTESTAIAPRGTPEERDTTKERTVISQEETEVAVAALLGETFSYGSCYSGSPPAEPEPAVHDEEEMRQAVQSLNSDVKPSTPQSESDLQIDTDAEESEEFMPTRYDFIPGTPDLEAGPPKTPDISPSFLAQNNKSFVRKDTTRNSRDEMDLNILSSPVKEADSKPPVLTPPSPKVIPRDEPPIIEPQVRKSPEKVFVESLDSRLLLTPPPLVPVSKQISPSPPRSSPNIAIVRPIITLSSPPTLVFTPIRTTLAPTNSSPLGRKTYSVAPSGLIPSRVALPPPVLSPVTPNAPISPSSIRTPAARFVGAPGPTMVSPRQIPAHIMTGKILVPSPRVSVPQTRPVLSTSESVVVRARPIQQASMPALALSEPTHRNTVVASTCAVTTVAPTAHSTSSIIISNTERTQVGPLSPRSCSTVTVQSSIKSSSVPQLSVAPRSVATVQSQEKSLFMAQSHFISRSTPLQIETSAKSPMIPQCPVAPVLLSPVVHHAVPALVPSKPLITTVCAPSMQSAQKTVFSPIVSASTVMDTNKAEVSVICQKLSAEKAATLTDYKNHNDDEDEKNSAEFTKLINEIQSKAAASGKVDIPDGEKTPIKMEIKVEMKTHIKTEVKKEMVDNNNVNLKTPECKEEPIVKKVATENTVFPLRNGLNPLTEVLSAESVIKRLESHDVVTRDESPNKCSDHMHHNNTDEGSRDESSDDDKPINALARKSKKKSVRGGSTPRRGGRATTPKAEIAANTTPCTRRGGRSRGGRSGSDGGKKLSADVYEFHDESDDEKAPECERPRLVITIKNSNNAKEQPAIASVATTSIATATVAPTKASSLSPKEVPLKPVKSPLEPFIAAPIVREKELTPEPQKQSPKDSANTRKSRRLLEKDSKSSIDEVIEDVIKNVRNSPRRSTRQVLPSTSPPAKQIMPPPPLKKAIRTKKVASEEGGTASSPKTLDGEELVLEDGRKESTADVPRPEEVNETSDEEPTTLIDPVTGMLMVMRVKEGGKYVPVPNATPVAPPTPPPVPPAVILAKPLTPPLTVAMKVSPTISVPIPLKTSPSVAVTANTVMMPPVSKPEPLQPVVTEGIASHWLTQEAVKVVAKNTPVSKPELSRSPFMSCPPPTSPVTTLTSCLSSHGSISITTAVPLVKTPETVMRTVPRSVEPVKPAELSLVKIPSPVEPHLLPKDPNKLRVERVVYPQEYLALKASHVKAPPRAKTIVLPPGKQLYQAVRCVQPGGKGPLLPGSVAVAGSPPTHDLHPLTGAVASPPPRAPHFASQQPIVAGASSSRAFGDSAKGPRASPRPLTISPYEPTLHKSGHSGQSPPPAHQQGDGVTLGHLPFVHHPPFPYQPYMPSAVLPGAYRLGSAGMEERGAGDMGHSPPLELRRPTDPLYLSQHLGRYYDEPPPAHLHLRQSQPAQKAEAPSQPQPRIQVATPPHASQVPSSQDSLLNLLQNYPIMWQGLLALKNDQSAVQMYFVLGNVDVARDCLRNNPDGSTTPLRIAQRMRLEHQQLEGVARKMQIENEHCMLLALPCGRDHVDVLRSSTNLQNAFISYLQTKQAAGIVNVAYPDSVQPGYVVHIFPSCDFANANLARVAPDLVHRMQEIPHLIIVIATV